MFKKAKPFFMIVQTPLHAGSGTDLGIVDMPIQRERHTSFPKIEASGVKGSIRQAFTNCDKKAEGRNGDSQSENKVNDKNTISLAFGPEDGDAHAGALGFTDARLLLFPIKSMKGIFAWITCPRVLNKFNEDLNLADLNGLIVPEENTSPKGCKLFVKDDKIVFEEYTVKIKEDTSKDGICTKLARILAKQLMSDEIDKYWLEKMQTDIIVLPDDDFKDFVNLSTEVITRIKINQETGTVQPGALFTEEYLPSESVMYSLALTTPIFKKAVHEKGIFKYVGNKKEEELVMDYFVDNVPEVLQIGGNATIGKGIVRVKVWEEGNDGEGKEG